MCSNQSGHRWIWDAAANPAVSSVFSPTRLTSEWWDDLENAPADPVVGKVLCVVAGCAIARAVLAKDFPSHPALANSLELLDLTEAWIDDPTDVRSDKIAEFLFGDDTIWPTSDPRHVVWAALRVAMSTVGNYEAAWALSSVVDDASGSGIDARKIAKGAVESRST